MDVWTNPCGHRDTYADVAREAANQNAENDDVQPPATRTTVDCGDTDHIEGRTTMHDTSLVPPRRFTLDPHRARTWLLHAVAAHGAPSNADEPPGDLDGPHPDGHLPELHDTWDPREPGSETDVGAMVRDAVDAGIICTPADERINGKIGQWDLDFVHFDDGDGGAYCFMLRLGAHLKLATFFEDMRKLGEPHATGITAALAVLTEAVTSANATLAALDTFVAARAHQHCERHPAGVEPGTAP